MPDTDTTDTTKPALRPVQLCILIVSILTGIVAAHLLAPYVFSASPTDLNRNGYLLKVLASPDRRPKQVILGNSIAMRGVDARIIADDLPGHPETYNLATTGQGLTEANLFFSVLPDSVETVIHVFYVNQLQVITVINEQKYNAMYMFGYRMPEELEKELIRIYAFNSADILGRSAAKQSFESRWAPRQAIDSIIRDQLRDDLDLDEVRTNLYFPSSMSPPLPEDKLQKNLADTYRDQSSLGFTTYFPPEEHLDSFIKQVKASGRNYVMVVAPLNPAGARYFPDSKIATATEVLTKITSSNDVLMINAISLLKASEFSDALHPTAEGAVILSRFIAAQMNQHASELGLSTNDGGNR